VTFLQARFGREGDAQRAVGAKAYMKSALRFVGVTQAQLRAAARDYVTGHPELTRSDLHQLSRAAFATDAFEVRSGAIAILERKRKLLTEEDLSWQLDLVREASCWAHVDWLATKVIGFVVSDGPLAKKSLRLWARDPHLWVRRTALLAQEDALRSGTGDYALFAQIAEPMLVERELWIRKAIGWVLRDLSRKRPELTCAFLRQHATRCSGLICREASKHLDPAVQAELRSGSIQSNQSTRRRQPLAKTLLWRVLGTPGTRS